MNTDEKLANRDDSDKGNPASEEDGKAGGKPGSDPQTLPPKGAEQNGLAAFSRSRFRLRRRGCVRHSKMATSSRPGPARPSPSAGSFQNALASRKCAP
jgi:hypothetical protein